MTHLIACAVYLPLIAVIVSVCYDVYLEMKGN